MFPKEALERHLLAAVIACVTVALSAKQLNAVVIPPTDLPPGSRYQLIFVTKNATFATDPNISYYNDFVTAEAGLNTSLPSGLVWRAIGSTLSVDAIDNAPTWDDPPTPIYNTRGEKVASGRNQLWNTGGLSKWINYDQFGDSPSFDFVFTGTGSDGLKNYALGTGAIVMGGNPVAITSFWVQANMWLNPYVREGFYALSSPVPEPSTLALLGVGSISLLAYAWWRLRKQSA